MMMNQFLPIQGEESNEIKTSFLKVRGKTLILRNSIYQIANISSIDLVDLSTTKPMPRYFIWLFLIGIALLFFPDNFKILGVIVLCVLGWFFYQYQVNKSRTRYGVSIGLNSGKKTVIVSDDIEFLTRVVLVLNNIMNSDELSAVNINFDQRQIDESVIIGEMHGSNLVTGTVVGDVASNV
jgi:Family of unknown function (DUF6232)